MNMNSIFEVVDASEEEVYWQIGVWESFESAVKAIEEYESPWNWCEQSVESGSVTIEIRQRALNCFRPLEIGKRVWRRTWVEVFDQKTGEPAWRVDE